MALTKDEMARFHEQGYLIVEGVLDEKDVLRPLEDEYAALLDGLVKDWTAEGRMPKPPVDWNFERTMIEAYRAGCDWFQHMDISLPGDRIEADTPMHFGPAVFNLITNDRMLDLAEAFVGPEISSNPIQHVRFKMPSEDLRGGEIRSHIALTDWHQDRGVGHAAADETNMITMWCAVTDATEENGCLRVIEGAHRSGLMPHVIKTQPSIVDKYLDRDKIKPLPVPRGGVLFLHPLMPHSSLPNRSGGIRWSFDLRYHKTGQPSGRDHFPAFTARSRKDPESELRDWRTWLGMWEDARAKLAASPHIELHRWPLEDAAAGANHG